jgi:hypothetical protein
MIIKAGVETGEVVKKFLIFNDYIFWQLGMSQS